MAHYVICSVCKERFDRDRIQAVKSGAKRYAHQACFPEGEIVPLGEDIDKELVELEEYIKTLFSFERLPIKIRKQIKEFKEQYNYSYSGMRLSLYWFYELKQNDINKANGGIGIVPYIYKEAYEYFHRLYIAQQANKTATIEKLPTKIIKIKPPAAERPKIKMFDF